MGNNPINARDPSGLWVAQAVGGLFNAGTGALIRYYTDGGSGWDYAKDFAIDFGVGALSSGAGGFEKFATLTKILDATNTSAAKFITAGGAEIGKGASGDGVENGTYVQAAVAGGLNATGIIGTSANWLAKTTGAISDGFRPNPSVAALLQAPSVPATSPAAVALINGAIGALPNYGAGYASALLGNTINQFGLENNGGSGGVVAPFTTFSQLLNLGK